MVLSKNIYIYTIHPHLYPLSENPEIFEFEKYIYYSVVSELSKSEDENKDVYVLEKRSSE